MPYDSEFSKHLLNILQNMVSLTAKPTCFKELLFPFFKIFYTLIEHYVINFVFSKLESNYIEKLLISYHIFRIIVVYSYNDINYTYLYAYKLSSSFS